MPIPTPHINAKAGDFARTVLMPGDPLRAKYIAETYFENPVLVTSVRNMLGYTGSYKGHPVSVMGSGMGMPSIGIYSYELFNFYEVDNIIRIGSAGGLQEDVAVRDVLLGQAACTDSNYAYQFGLPGSFAPIASMKLLRKAMDIADKMNLSYKVGNLLSGDVFYNVYPDVNVKWRDMGVLGIEMESAALYLNAAKAKKSALSICTVSDHVFTGESLSSEERQNTFHEMMLLALNLACELD